MSKFSRGILRVILLSTCTVGIVLSSIIGNDPTKNFKEFSHNLLLQSDLDEFSVEKGAAVASPFGVGYMLANINERVWNVSNKGLGQVLHAPEGKVADEYQALIDLLSKGRVSTGSTLYSKDQNVTSPLPGGSQKLKTDMKFVDFIDDWKTTWLTMNSKTSNETNGRLDDQLIPKGGWWGGAFYYFTMGAYINTNHYKSSWASQWTSVGVKKFHDGLEVPYYETEGNFPFLDVQNYTAVSIPLKEGKKSVVLVFPKIHLVEFLKTEMPGLTKNPLPSSWNTEKARKIQLPYLNITLLDQHYKKLEALGVNYTFCVDEPSSPEVATGKEPFFMGPVVQSHHVRFTPEFFEVASATGSSLNSEEKMKDEAARYVGLAPPSEGETSEELSSPADESATGSSSAAGSEFILPVEMEPKLAASIASGAVQVEQVDVIVADNNDNDTTSAAASTNSEVVVPPPGNGTIALAQNETSSSSAPAVQPPAPSADIVSAIPVQGPSDIEAALESVSTLPPPTTTPFVPEVLPEGTIRFDRPFFWFLNDEDMGPLYYGTIHSIATYQKEYGIESDEDLWLYDAYKTLLWNCP